MSSAFVSSCPSRGQSIRQNLSTTVAATMTVLIGMCLLGLFIALGTWVLSWSDHLQDELQVKVYFCTTVSDAGCSNNATQAQEQAVGAALQRRPARQERRSSSPRRKALARSRRSDPRTLSGAYAAAGESAAG